VTTLNHHIEVSPDPMVPSGKGLHEMEMGTLA